MPRSKKDARRVPSKAQRIPDLQGHYIARRCYRWRPPTGKERAVVVEIYAPVRSGREWACRLRITGLPREEEYDRAIFGMDAVQALELALQAAGLLLSRSPEFRAGQIDCWGKPVMDPIHLFLPLPLHSLQGSLDVLTGLLQSKTGLKKHEEWRRGMLTTMREISLDLATLATHVSAKPRRRSRVWERSA